MNRKQILFLFLITSIHLFSQKHDSSFFSGCATNQLLINNNTLLQLQNSLDLSAYNFFQNNNINKPAGVNTIVYIPVVVHIIHNGGAENISNTQVQTAINNINSKFAESNNYQIQFCLAQRDPIGNSTNGITRDVDALTVETMEVDDISLKNINRWPPTCYLNIWIVRDINSLSMGSGVIGYAYFPSAHGQNMDGIVIEADYFGISADNDGVGAHEIGHYLGLYHTFQNACTNNNCLLDGDQVCDTPPDQTTFSACIPSANSCNTDNNDPSVNNPFTSDVSDLSNDYMDYSNLSCYTQFTAGQYNRMEFFLTTTRNSLLNCLSCMSPCPTPVTSQIILPVSVSNIVTGNSVNFAGTVSNSSSYQWYLYPSTILSTNTSYSHVFNTAGSYWMKFKALSSNPSLCLDGIDSIQVIVIEPTVLSCKGSLEFGTSNDGVYLPLTNQMYSSNGFTWECWFKLTTPLINNPSINTRALICNVDPAVYEDIFLGFGWNLGTGNMPFNHIGFKVDGNNFGTGPTNVSCSYAPPGGFLTGIWYHTAGVMDYTNHTAKLYLNGALVDTKTVNSDPFFRNILGQLSYDAGLGLRGGNMDEVRIWKRIRTASEIAASYNQCLAGNETDLLMYYRCNQSAGSLVTDATVNSYDGTLVNATIWSLQQPTLANSCSSNCNDICDNKVSANKDTTLCVGGSANLNASNGFNSYIWRPGNTLSDSTAINPIANPINTTSYIVTATKLDSNLIVNADFSAGNTGFISGYTFNNSNFNPCNYSVSNSIFGSSTLQNDHTPTSDNMFMMVDGCTASPSVLVWQQTVSPILPNTDYRFSFWIGGDTTSANIQIKINGTVINTFTYIPGLIPNFPWYQYSYTWNSNTNTSAVLELFDLSVSATGNNFGLDDFAFQRVCSSSDTVNVVIRNKVVPNLDLGNDTAMCANSVLVLNAGSGFIDYHWNDGSLNSTYTAYGIGKYWVTVKDSCGNFHSDTVKVDLLPYPLLDLGNNKSMCYGDSILLSFSPLGIFNTYQWSPAFNLDCIHCANPIVSPTTSTKYYLTATTANGCTVSDSILISVGQNTFSGVTLNILNSICGEANGEIRISDLDNNFSPYQFNFNQVGYTSAFDYLNLSNGTYSIQIKDNNGCVFDTIAILDEYQLEETVSIPNCFSPNADGANDHWYIKGTCIQSIECKIFNRWGEQMKSINNINDGWDGKYHGVQVPDGVYYYILEVNYYSGVSKYQGFISVFR
jgi:gliding motility-associated-like protein